MELVLPPPPPSSGHSAKRETRSGNACFSGGWERIEPKGASVPCQRSLHAGAVWKDSFIVFGGYDGHHRVNDLYSYNFKSNQWQPLSSINAPTPRDRHVATVFDNSLYIFGGFDGAMRVNDLHAYDLERNEWCSVDVLGGSPPTPRHSHAAVVYQQSMFVFGGYDGSYRSDLNEFNFMSRRWFQVQCGGDIPRARYRGTCVVSEDSMILHGGHDGNRHLQDTHVFDFVTLTWSALVTEGPVPAPRDSHVSVIHGKSMFLYGGSTGSAMGDFHELKLEFRRVWSPVQVRASHSDNPLPLPPGSASGSMKAMHRSGSFGTPGVRNSGTFGTPGGGGTSASSSVAGTPNRVSSAAHMQQQQQQLSTPSGELGNNVEGVSPGVRFCHVGVIYESALYIFGGYDGTQRLNDFLRFRFDLNEANLPSPPSTLITDLKAYVNNEVLSDIQFIVEGIPIHAHKILCLRCPYFSNMLTGEYMESRAREVVINDVKYPTFLLLLQYLYSDEVDIAVDNAMDLFQVADRFGLDRLKRLCELEMLHAINIETAAHILYTADQHNAENLRERCLAFILQHFDEISRTTGFEEMGRINVDLVFEILRRR